MDRNMSLLVSDPLVGSVDRKLIRQKYRHKIINVDINELYLTREAIKASKKLLKK